MQKYGNTSDCQLMAGRQKVQKIFFAKQRTKVVQSIDQSRGRVVGATNSSFLQYGSAPDSAVRGKSSNEKEIKGQSHGIRTSRRARTQSVLHRALAICDLSNIGI